MQSEMDLKALERKVYLAYHQDGLLDIALGLFILAFGLFMIWEMPWLAGALYASGVAGYAGAKKALTVPRLGVVHFSEERQSRLRRETGFYIVFFTITCLLGVVMFIVAASGGIQKTPWLRHLFEHFRLWPIGLIGVVALAALAYWKQLNRYYAYAVLILCAVFIGPMLAIPHPAYLITVGGVIMAAGLVVLVRFLRAYPRADLPVTGRGSHAG
ncbi:MAG: hypothetical protein ACETWG_09075 [Candidatus Neomarinimicrobiota bacterium]